MNFKIASIITVAGMLALLSFAVSEITMNSQVYAAPGGTPGCNPASQGDEHSHNGNCVKTTGEASTKKGDNFNNQQYQS